MPLAGFSRVRRIDVTVIDITVEGAAMRRRIALVVMSLVAFVAAGCSSSKPSSSASSATTASGQAVPTTSAPAVRVRSTSSAIWSRTSSWVVPGSCKPTRYARSRGAFVVIRA